ncbi:MAG: TolC family outer membrane protein [Chromatiales bacterium]
MRTKTQRVSVCALCATVWAGAAAAEDLTQVYQLAEQKDPRFKSVEASLEAVKELRPQAQARLMLPTLSATGDTFYNDQEVEIDRATGFGGGDFNFNTRGYSIDLTQPVYHYDRYMRLKQADSRIRQAQLELDASRQDLIVRVAERYFGVLAGIDNLEFSRAEKTALGRQLEQTQQRFDVGLIAITDVQEAKAGYDLSVAQEIEAQNLLDDAREALREFTDEYHERLSPLGDALPLVSPQPADAQQWADTALQQNLGIASADAAAQAAAEEIKVQYAGHQPSLDIIGRHGTDVQGGRFGATTTDASAIGLEVNVPIYEGGQVRSRTREATYRHEAALQSVEERRRSAVRQSRDAYAGVISGISRVQALQQAVVSTQTALEATRTGYEVGTRTAVDVVNQERELLRAKRDSARARYDYVLDTLRLKQAAGTLSPNDLNEVNRWLLRQ